MQEYSPFYPPTREVRSVHCRNIRLVIGWIDEKQGMKPTARVVGGDRVLALKGAWEPPFQKLAETTLDVPIDVLVREGAFDRRMPLQ